MIIRQNLKDIDWNFMDSFHKRLYRYLKRNISRILNACDDLSLADKQIFKNQASSLASEELFWVIQCEQYTGYKRKVDFNRLYNWYYPLCIGAELDYGRCKQLLSELIEKHTAIRMHIDDNYSDFEGEAEGANDILGLCGDHQA